MKNYAEILKDNGIDIPEDKSEAIGKAIAENYKTIAEVDKKVGKLEAERDREKERADTAETTLKGFDGVDVAKMKSDINEWKTKAEKAESEYSAKIAERDFNDALEAELNNIKFSSNAAKKAVREEIKSAGLKMYAGKIVGLKEVIETIKENDASAFADEKEAPAKFTAKTINEKTGKEFTREEILKIENPVERQKAIANNIALFRKDN